MPGKISVRNPGRTINLYVADHALLSGDPVFFSSNDHVDRADANVAVKSRVIGLNASSSVLAGSRAILVSVGPNPGVLSGATFGTPYYLQGGGGIGTVPGERIILVGYAINATDLFVRISDFGRKS